MDKRTAITAICGTIAIFASTQAHAEGTIIFGQRGKNLEQALNSVKQVPNKIVDNFVDNVVDHGKKVVKEKIDQLFRPIRLEFGQFSFLDSPLFVIEYSIPTDSAQMTVTPVQPKEAVKQAAKNRVDAFLGRALKL